MVIHSSNACSCSHYDEFIYTFFNLVNIIYLMKITQKLVVHLHFVCMATKYWFFISFHHVVILKFLSIKLVNLLHHFTQQLPIDD